MTNSRKSRIVIDFETRSEVDLRACGPWVYAEDPSTEILCIGWKTDRTSGLRIPENFHTEGLELLFPGSKSMFPQMFINTNYVWEAHNAEFERAIWHHICHKRWGWPDIPIDRWECSAAKAAALSLPRDLAGAGKAIGLNTEKDMEGRRIMLKMCKPRKPKKAEKLKWIKEQEFPQKFVDILFTEEQQLRIAERDMPTLWHETPEDLIKLFKYCIRDVETEYELSNTLRRLSKNERRIWRLDQTINTRGIAIDTEGAKAAVDIIKEQEQKLLDELSVLTDGKVKSPRQVAAMLSWLDREGVTLPNLQKATVAEIFESGKIGVTEQHETKWVSKTDPKDFKILKKELIVEKDLKHFPEVKRALEIRQSLGKSSTAKFQAMLNRTNEDGRARGLCMYHGSHTGRWSGKGIQPQNLPRPEFDDTSLCIEAIKMRDTGIIDSFWGDPMRALASCVRGMLYAPEGKELICADFSSIEARVLAWLAGESHVLEAFIMGLDLYKVAAADIYNVKYENVDTEQRRIGKVAVLALGFQGGGAGRNGKLGALQTMAIGYGVDLSNEKADDIKDKWRAANPSIVQLWYAMENIAMQTVRTGKSHGGPCGVVWGMRDGFLFCKLPSGRLMAYYQPMLQMRKVPWGEKEALTYMGVDGYTRQWGRIPTYGGKLVENIVQAIARDLLAGGMERVEEADYPVVLHVHDEIVSEVDEGYGSLKEFEGLMAEVPEWARGCPIAAEGWRGKRYRK